MKVYYFTTSKYGLNNIGCSRLKVSTFDKLNDPFELLAINMSDQKTNKELIFKKSKITESNGLICFSRDWQNPVQ